MSRLLPRGGDCLNRMAALALFTASPKPAILILGYLCVACFVIALVLTGMTKLAGLFYVLAMLLGAPLLFLVEWRRVHINRAALVFSILYLGLLTLYAGHMIFGEGQLNSIENIVRIGAGLINGLFFFVMFRCRRAPLFGLLVMVAALNALLLSAFAISSGLVSGSLLHVGARVDGASNAIAYSELLAVSFGAVLIYAGGRISRAGQWRYLALLAVLAALGLLALLMTGTRGTLLAMPVLAVLVALALRVRHAIWASFLILVVLAGVAFTFSPAMHKRTVGMVRDVKSLITEEVSGSSVSVSTRMRYRLWAASIEMSKDRLLFGYGQGQFNDALKSLRPRPPEARKLYIFDHAHNQFLNILVEGGLVGLLLFVGMLATMVYAGARCVARSAYRERGLVLVWVALAYSVFGLTQAFFLHGVTTLQFGVYAGLLLWAMPERRGLRVWPFGRTADVATAATQVRS